MKHEEFEKDMEFWMSGKKWRVTDVGARTIVAIWIGEYDWLEQPDTNWYKGPPYAVKEHVIDENDQPACAINREDSNG